MRDRIASVGLLAAATAFAALVFTARPSAAPAIATAAIDTSAVERGVLVHALQLPPGISSVDLVWMPERLTNEAAPATLRQVISVRGVPGVASVETPAVISWTEAGIVYWLISPTRSTSDLVRIADELAP